MKKLLFAVCIFTALTFLALQMGDIAQSKPPGHSNLRTHGIKAFEVDNGDMAVQAKQQGKSKAEMSISCENCTGNIDIEVIVTNPCTYVRVGDNYYKKCY
jgi:hypothetical protein